jgi:hypothetical protein
MGEQRWSVVSVGRHPQTGATVVTVCIERSIFTISVRVEDGYILSEPDGELQKVLDRVFEQQGPSELDERITGQAEDIMAAIAQGTIPTF